MTTMRLTQRLPVGSKEEVKLDINPTNVAYLKENEVVLVGGIVLDVKESLRSLRHQHRKALAEQAALAHDEPDTP